MPLTSLEVNRICFPPNTFSTPLRNPRNPNFSFYREGTGIERARALLPRLRRQRLENPGQLEMRIPQEVYLGVTVESGNTASQGHIQGALLERVVR